MCEALWNPLPPSKPVGYVLLEKWHSKDELKFRVARQKPYESAADFDTEVWKIDRTSAYIDGDFFRLQFAVRDLVVGPRPMTACWQAADRFRPQTAFEEAVWEALCRFAKDRGVECCFRFRK